MNNFFSDNNFVPFIQMVGEKTRSRSGSTDTDSESSVEFSKSKKSRCRSVHFCAFVNVVFIPHPSDSIQLSDQYLWYGSRELKLFQTEAFKEAHLYVAYHNCTVKQATTYLYQPSEVS